jgi:hypothetical protein
MAKLTCQCENSLSNSSFQNTIEGHIKVIYEYVYKDVWERDERGRLSVDMKDEKVLTISKWYNPEDGKTGNLFDELRQEIEDEIKRLKNENK